MKKIYSSYKYLIIVTLALVAIYGLTSVLSGRNQLSNSDQLNSYYSKLNNQLSDQVDEKVIATSNTDSTSESSQSENTKGKEILETAQGQILNSTSGRNTQGFVYTLITVINSMMAPVETIVVETEVQSQDGTMRTVYYPAYNSANAGSQLMKITGELYNTKPMSVEVWAQDIKDRLNPLDSVEASASSTTYNPGQGYNLLQPIKPLWRATTNLVYIFYIVIIIVIAFLIVFQAQLDGQNAINLFNALPSIILSLVLVYFSYPLSAVFIDLITVGSGMSYGVLIGNTPASAGGTAPGAYLLDYQLTTKFIDDFGATTKFDARTGLQINDRYVSVWRVFDTAGINPTAEGVGSIIPQDVPFSNVLSSILTLLTTDLPGGFNPGDLILTLVFVFAAFTATIKLFLGLLKEYIILTFLPVISPFLFLYAAVPGRTGPVISWYFRRLLAAVAGFLVVYILSLVVVIISRQPGNIGDLVWVPPLLGYTNDQFSTNPVLNQEIVKPVLAYGLFITIPVLLDQIVTLIGGPMDSPILQNLAQTTQQGAGYVGGIARGINSFITPPEAAQQQRR